MIQRFAYDDKCWWCGSKADSREHKYKKADIVHLFGRGPYQGADELVRIVEGEGRVVRGPKSKELMFVANLCQKCNNERSQPFDLAYDTFVSHLGSNSQSIIASKEVHFSNIFSSDWMSGRDNLIRYYVKHICCRLSEAGVLVDPKVIAYLNGEGDLACVEMAFELREDIVAMEAKLTSDQMAEGSVWMGDGVADHHQATNTFSVFRSHVGYRWFRVAYQYDDTFSSDFMDGLGESLRLTPGYSVDPSDIL